MKSMYIGNTVGNRGRQRIIYEREQEIKPDVIGNEKTDKKLRMAEDIRAGAGKDNGADAVRGAGESVPVVAEISDKGKALFRMSQKTKNAKKKKSAPSNALSKALAIARRLMKGDKVPPKDESFLFRYNSDLYLKAKMMAMQNQKPEKHKSLLEELKEKGAGGTSCSSHASSVGSSSGSSEAAGSGETGETGGEAGGDTESGSTDE